MEGGGGEREIAPSSPAAAAGEEKIFVSVRLRPLNEKEILRRDVSDWECINDTTIIYKNPNLSVSERSMYPTAYSFGKNLCFFWLWVFVILLNFCFSLLII